MKVLCKFQFLLNSNHIYDYFICYENEFYLIIKMLDAIHIYCDRVYYENNKLTLKFDYERFLSDIEYDIASKLIPILVNNTNYESLIISQIKQNERLLKIDKLHR